MRFLTSLVSLKGVLRLLSGCLFFGEITPTPKHKEIVSFEADFTNQKLTELLVSILAANNVAPCRSGLNRHNEASPDCFVPWWQGNLTQLDRNSAVIEIGNFGTYPDGAGHTARLRRISKNMIEITVRGVGPYYSEIPNKDVAKKLAKIVHVNLNASSSSRENLP